MDIALHIEPLSLSARERGLKLLFLANLLPPILSLWRRKLWSYPSAIVFFILFIIYQMYRYTHHHSAWLILLSILDVIVVMLTWLEYGNLKRAPR